MLLNIVRGAKRIVAIGDAHGDFDSFVQILRKCSLIDEKNDWSGGNTTFVQVGDVLDRGPHSRKILDLIIKLEKQSLEQKGWIKFVRVDLSVYILLKFLVHERERDFHSWQSRSDEHHWRS